MSAVLKVDNYFLSAENASATADQRDIEALALKVYDMPAVQKAKAMAAMRWKAAMSSEVPADGWSRFDAFMEEWNFNHVLKAVNSDANYPKVLGHLFGPAHEWFGMKVPGSRAGGGDSPDNNYVIAKASSPCSATRRSSSPAMLRWPPRWASSTGRM
jgi:hypothetical protein